MTFEMDEIRRLIPQYLNKSLSPEKRKEFEEVLKNNPDLKKEVSEFLAIKKAYEEMEKELAPPSDALYEKIQTAIKSSPDYAARPGIGAWEKALEGFRKFCLSPRVSWSVAAVQFAVIVLLLVSVMPKDADFHTLTSTDISKKDEIRINLVFEPDTREKEMREILNRIGAKIVDGPSRQGLYIIGISAEAQAEKALLFLNREKVVKYAEKRY
jgi:hypothetical protein